MRFFFLILLLPFNVLISYAQSSDGVNSFYETSILDVKKGLISNNVTDCVRDKNGFLWVATEDGITRYAAKNSIHFNVTSHPGFKDQKVNWLLFGDSVIWAASATEIYKINIYTLQLDAIGFNEKYGNIKGIIFGSKSELLIATDQGILANYHLVAHKISYTRINGVSLIYSLCMDDDGILFLAAEPRQQIVKYDLYRKKILKVFEKINLIQYSHLVKTKKEGILFCSASGLLQYDHNKDGFVLFDKSMGVVRGIIEYGEGLVAIRDENSIFYFDKKTRVKSTIPYNRIAEMKRMFVDEYGNLMVSTRQGMLVAKNILRFQKMEEPVGVDPQKRVRRSIVEDKEHNRILFFTYDGIDVYNTVTNQYEKRITNITNAFSTCRDGNYIWITTESRRIFRLELSSMNLEQFYELTDKDHTQNFISIYKNNKNQFLVGGYTALYLFDATKKIMQPLSINYKGKDFSKLMVSTIVRRNAHEIWIGTDKGIFVLNNDFSVKERYAADQEGEFHLPINNVNDLYFDSKGCYVGLDNDLYYISFSAGSNISVFAARFGNCDRVIAIGKDLENRIWFSAYSGLYCFDPSLNKIRSFHAPQYFSNNEFNRKSFLITNDGSLYLGSVAEFIKLDTRNYNINSERSSFSFNKIALIDNGKTTLSFNPDSQTIIRFPSPQAVLNASFFYQEIFDQDAVSYYYKIPGLANDWIELGDRASVELFSLPGGNWTLDIKAVDKHNLVANSISLPIFVPTVFYKTGWFFLLMLLIGGLIFWAIYRYRIYQYQKMMSYRVDMANDLHDTVGTTVTKTIFAAEGLLKDYNIKDVRLVKIAEYGRQINSSFRDALWSADQRTDSIDNLTDRIIEIGQAATENTRFGFKLHREGNFPALNLYIAQKRNILLIVREALNNALKYSNGDFIHIYLKRREDIVVLEIMDNGQNESGVINDTGMGIRSMQIRAKKINASITFEKSLNGFWIKLVF